MKEYFEIQNLQELDSFVNDFFSRLEKRNEAIVIALFGDLGAGKTTLVKSVARFLGVEDEITSPTFVIQKEYDIEKHPFFKRMIHIDAYRLQSSEELEYLGWDELVRHPEHIIFIEWPEQVEGIFFPSSTYRFEIEILPSSQNVRSLRVQTS